MSKARHWFCLRFQVSGTEAYFVQRHSEQLLKNMSCLCLLGAMTCCALLLLLIARMNTISGSADLKALALGVDISCIAVFVVVGLSTRVQRIIKLVSPQMLEVVAVLVMAYFVVAIFMVDLYYSTKIMGYDPEVLFPKSHFSDTRPLLALSVMMTSTHCALPIRWIILFPVEVFSCLVYSAYAFILGGPDGLDAWSSLLLYVCLVLCSAIGRRTIENHQRDALSQLIEERSLRVEAEYKLTQIHQAGRSQLPEDVLSTRVSRPETTSSAEKFLKAEEDGNLAGVVEVGRREQWLIEFKDLKMVDREPLGQGGFGEVIVGFYAGSPAAIKLSRITSSSDGESSPNGDQQLHLAILNEIRIMRRLHHANIASFYGACLDIEGSDAALVLEWVHGPCLEKFILRNGVPDSPLRVQDQFKAIMDTCSAVCYLHSRQPCIVHGDLKGTNVMMERCPGRPDVFRAKLLDFGLSRVLTRHTRPLGGTVRWMAPEVVQSPEAPAAAEADVFSFGRLSYFVLTGLFPFGGRSKEQILEVLRSGSLPCLHWPSAVASCPLTADWRPWIEDCSRQELDRRPRAEDISERIWETVRKVEDSAVTDGILGLPVEAARAVGQGRSHSGGSGWTAPGSSPAELELREAAGGARRLQSL